MSELRIILPPTAQLPRARAVLQSITNVLDDALEPTRRFHRVRDDLENDLCLAAAVHALSGLDAARAILVLADEDHGNALAPHARTIVEAFVKIAWMRQDRQRARDYLESEPFERFAHATPAVRASNRWNEILRDCDTAVKQCPDLLNLKKAVDPNTGQPDYKAIAKALRMPSFIRLAAAIGLDQDDYLVDFDFHSFTPHTSVLHAKTFFRAVNPDSSVTATTKMDPCMLIAIVARAANNSARLVNEILSVFPDGAVLFKFEKAVEELAEMSAAVNGLIRDES
ncbi:MAG: hypothetical protein JO036_07455 [Candidatus Eremiobacteraeota bacterium]|nr:hypothetical protein [Candidatus Eremiobacteraeota bacterium]